MYTPSLTTSRGSSVSVGKTRASLFTGFVSISSPLRSNSLQSSGKSKGVLVWILIIIIHFMRLLLLAWLTHYHLSVFPPSLYYFAVGHSNLGFEMHLFLYCFFFYVALRSFLCNLVKGTVSLLSGQVQSMCG